MFRALLFAVGLCIITSASQVLAQGHVTMTPGLLRYIHNSTTYAPFPQYDTFALVHQFEGSGIFLLHLRSDGTVSHIDIVKSTGHLELDEDSISALRQWRFRQSVAEKAREVKIPVMFDLPHRFR